MPSPAPERFGHVTGVFARLERGLPQVARGARAGAVHHLRTHIRRVEALLDAGLPAGDEPKLRQQLQKLRRRAGRVRELDVQGQLLEDFQVEGGEGARRRLLEAMAEERGRRAARLQRILDAEHRRQLRGRLRRAQERLVAAAAEEPEAWAERVQAGLGELERRFPLLQARNLHAFRLACKRLRYWAEADGAALAPLAEQLKRVQDAIGAWHDRSELARRARGTGGALEAGLRNLAAAEGLEALRVATAERQHWRTGAAAARRPPARAGVGGIRRRESA